MRREDAEKLLGGHAAGTLTDAERRALMEAALTDQELFDALMREEGLRELLEDPEARRRIEQAVAPGEAPETGGFAAWLRLPRAWALAGAFAAAVVITVVIVRTPGPEQKPATFEMAKRVEPAAPAPPQIAAPEPPAPTTPPARRAPRDQAAALQAGPQNAPAAPAARGGVVGGAGGGAPAPPAPSETMAKARTDALAESPAEARPTGEAAPEREAQAERAPASVAPFNRAQRAGQPAGAAALTLLTPLPPPSLRYAVANGPQGTAQLTIDTGQPGYLYVLDASGILYSGAIRPGTPAVVVPPAATSRVSLLFSRTEAADPRTLLNHRPLTRQSSVPGGKVVSAAAPASFVAADVDLSR